MEMRIPKLADGYLCRCRSFQVAIILKKVPSFLEKNVRKKMTLLASGLLPKTGDVFCPGFFLPKNKGKAFGC